MSKARNLSDFISEAAIDATEIGSNAVTTDKVADQAVTPAKLHNSLDLSSKTVTLPTDGISGNSIHGGVISDFASTGIDDNATSTALTITSGGNVGVGTNSPGVKLEVDGIIASINSLQGTEQLQLQGYGGSAYINMNGSGSLIFRTGSTYVERARFRSEGYLELKSSDAYNQLVLTPIGTNAPASINFNTPGTGRAKIKVQDNEYISILSTGNVGIGTSSPNAKTHIHGSGDLLRLTSTNSGAGGAQIDLIHETPSPADGDFNAMINMGGYYSGSSSAYASSMRSVWTNAGGRQGRLEFYTRNAGDFTKQLQIEHNGNVGIGTSNPSEKLHVDGTVRADRFDYNAVNIGNVSSASVGMEWNRRYNFQIPANNTWYTVITNFRDTAGKMLATVSDSASGDVAEYVFRVTTPPYGVSMFSQLSYTDGGWNGGTFNFRIITNGSSFDLQCQYSSYYNSANNGTGRISFINI